MSESEYLIAKALNPFKAKRAVAGGDDFMRTAAGQRLKAMQAHNTHAASRAAQQGASDAAMARQVAGRAKAGGVLIPSRKAPPARYRPGGDTGRGPGWIGGGNS